MLTNDIYNYLLSSSAALLINTISNLTPPHIVDFRGGLLPKYQYYKYLQTRLRSIDIYRKIIELIALLLLQLLYCLCDFNIYSGLFIVFFCYLDKNFYFSYKFFVLLIYWSKLLCGGNLKSRENELTGFLITNERELKSKLNNIKKGVFVFRSDLLVRLLVFFSFCFVLFRFVVFCRLLATVT